MRRVQEVAWTAAIGGLMMTLSACTTADRVDPSFASNAPVSGEAVSEEIVLGDGRARAASRTASDWVTSADHVLVVTVVDETRHEPSRTEIERGEGLIGRSATLRVSEVLWSAPDARQPAPATLDLSVGGWVFNDNNDTGTVRFALSNSSRLEVGHTYVKALQWLDDPCFDDPDQGRWVGLGPGDSVPFDNGILGAGEFEGRVQTLDEATATWQASEPALPTLRGQMAGKSVDALVARLTSASPREEKGYEPTKCDLSDR